VLRHGEPAATAHPSPNQASRRDIERVSIVLGGAEIRGSRKPGKGRVAAKASLAEQIKAVYEGVGNAREDRLFAPTNPV
jgi:hypothetical protein